MKKFEDIKTFSDWDEEIENDSAHDINAVTLEKHGHKVICVDRSIAIIEQCETNSESPIENSSDALKITVHADKDLSPDEQPHEIFISANRWGSSEVVLKIGNKTFRANWIDSDL